MSRFRRNRFVNEFFDDDLLDEDLFGGFLGKRKRGRENSEKEHARSRKRRKLFGGLLDQFFNFGDRLLDQSERLFARTAFEDFDDLKPALPEVENSQKKKETTSIVSQDSEVKLDESGSDGREKCYEYMMSFRNLNGKRKEYLEREKNSDSGSRVVHFRKLGDSFLKIVEEEDENGEKKRTTETKNVDGLEEFEKMWAEKPCIEAPPAKPIPIEREEELKEKE